MFRCEHGPREEFVCFERRERCAFFEGNHRKDSASATHGGQAVVVSFDAGLALLGCAAPQRRAACEPSGEPSRNDSFYRDIVNPLWRRSHNVMKKI
jgi:hypothetical protein